MFSAENVLFERLGCEAVESVVGVAVACEFMAHVDDSLDEFGVFSCDPAECEECGFGLMLFECVEEPFGDFL